MLEQCRQEILAVLDRYPGITLEWSCDDCSDLQGITGDRIVLDRNGFEEIDLYE